MNSKSVFKIVQNYQSKAPPIDLEALCNDLGIELIYQNLGDDCSGSIEKSLDGESSYTIKIHAGDQEARQRFTIAHEIGHFLFHRHKIGDGIVDNRLYRSSETGTEDESQANSFAVSLLMPIGFIIERYNQGYSSDEIAGMLKVSKQSMAIKIRDMRRRDLIDL